MPGVEYGEGVFWGMLRKCEEGERLGAGAMVMVDRAWLALGTEAPARQNLTSFY